MSLAIARKLDVIGEIIPENSEMMTVGATVFIDHPLRPSHRAEINDKIDPQEIRTIEDGSERETRIEL